jgi:hypothetical protein
MNTLVRGRTDSRVLAVAALALIIVIVGAILEPRAAAAAFVVAYAAIVSVVLGTMTMIMIAHLTGANWFRPFRPHAEAVIATLPVLGVGGVLLLLLLPVLYRWMVVPAAARGYLNAPFFIARAIVYWIAWLTIARSLRSASRLEARGESVRAARRYRVTSAAGLIVLAFTMTFASFDWMMSLTPGWSSTIYGIYWWAGGMVGALALLAVLAVLATENAAPLTTADDLHALGKLLLTFILFWLYVAFAQYIVIWSGDLPREVGWYMLRARGGWGGLAVLLLLGTFVLPFMLLLIREVKRNVAMLAVLGAALLVMHYLDTYWLVMPGLVRTTWWTGLVGAAMLGLVGGAAAFIPRR